MGRTGDSDVYNCSNYACTFSERCSGGIFGNVYDNGSIYNCVNHGMIDGNELVGGISGGTTSADIENCLSVGQILYPYGHIIAGGAGSRRIVHCYGLQNEEVNTGISFGTSGTSAVFTDESAVLETPIAMNGVSHTRGVDFLNAWRTLRTDGIAYQQLLQEDFFPYLELDHIPSTLVMTEETFENVTPEKWFYDEAKYVYNNGLMNGTTTSTFEPDLETSQAMVVTILYRQEGEPAASAVNWAASVGVVVGYPDGSFQPEKHISRAEMATIMFRCSTYQEEDMSAMGDLSVFRDGQQAGWAVHYLRWAVGEGLLNGIDGYLKLDNFSSRSQVAAILMRYCTK